MTPSVKTDFVQARAVQIAHHAHAEVPDFPRIEKVVRVLCRQPPGRMLDVGYLKGSFADLLVEQGWRCTALDLDHHAHLKIRMIQCDLNRNFLS